MEYTENYGLREPQRGENVFVADINFNSEKIDDLLYKNRRISTGAEWDENTQYHEGDLVVYNHVLYRALADTTGAWDSTKWTATNLSAEVLEAKASGGTEVEANPTGTATGNLSKVGIDGTVYAIPTGTEVEANPTGSATDTLEKLGIGGTVYEIEGGGGSADVTKTAAGNPITFSDGADAPLVECKASISAKQDLHGYSKPWVGGGGKNKLEVNTTTRIIDGVTFTVNSDGSITANGTATGRSAIYYIRTSTAITDLESLNGRNVTMSGCPTNGSSDTYFMYAWHIRGNNQSVTDLGNGVSFNMNIVSGDTNITIQIANGYTANNIVFHPQIELGTEKTTFEPYSNICPIEGMDEVEVTVADDDTDPTVEHTYTIDLNGTRYGGELDVVRGVLQATWGYIASYAGETLPGRWLSDRDEYVSGTSPTTGAEVAYELATPQEIPLTAEQIRSLQGSNTITTDADTLSVEYITEDYQALVDLIEDGGGSSTLAELSDVDLATPADGQLLVYDGTSWVNGNIAGANVQPLIYSTEEREVGVWTDGKPLYQRTFEVANPTQSVIATGQTYDMAIVVGGYYILSDGNSMLEVNQFLSTANYAYVHVEKDGDIQYKIAGYSATKLVVTIQYTKTTDTPGSGTWTPSGIPAVHYSTEEQVVGTDTDGSTIYEITYTGGMAVPKGSWGSTGIEVTGRVVSVDGVITRDGEPIPFGFWTSSIVSIWLLRDSDIKVQMSSYQTTETYLLQRMTVRYTKAAATRSLSASATALKADISDEKQELEEISTEEETSLTKANAEVETEEEPEGTDED